MITPEDTVGARYRSVRLRLGTLLASLDGSQWDLPVDACPGWRVRDVLGHLVGIIEDASAGRLTGPPGPALTREQVERHRDDHPSTLLARWDELGPGFEEALTGLGRWPAFIDVLSHEHDIRTAIGDRSARDDGDVGFAAALLTASLPPEVELATGAGPSRPDRSEAAARVAVTPFEAVRIRLGRRSLAQVRALAWEGDPEPHLADLFVFGPAPRDLAE